MPGVGLKFVSVVFPDHTHILNILGGWVFFKVKLQNGNIYWGSLKFQIFFGYV